VKQIFSISRLRPAIVLGLLVLASGCASTQGPQAQAGATSSSQPMAGCGMMINGKMADKDTHGAPCMDMNKPANMMPNGVTMHSDPGVTSTPSK
jgi:hypothetical protein